MSLIKRKNMSSLEKNIKNEINYLKRITAISSQQLKNFEFLELEKQTNIIDFLKNLYLSENKFSITYVKRLLKITNQDDCIIEELFQMFNKKIKELDSKKYQEYHFPIAISFGTFYQKYLTLNQKKETSYKIVPLYVIPTLVKITYSYPELMKIEDLNDWKNAIYERGPLFEFFISDIPYVLQNLLNFTVPDEEKTLNDIPIFDISSIDILQQKMLPYFKELQNDKKELKFPLLEMKDTSIKENDYFEALELKNVTSNSLSELFELLSQYITETISDNKVQDFLKSENYHHSYEKIIISLCDKEIDVLYKAYKLISTSPALNDDITSSIASSFFQPTSNNVIEKNKAEKVFFNSKEHYGSFNIMINDNQLHSLSLNQRIVLNSTTSNNFKKNDTITVNGPPGTGKTTVLQSIIANLITENVLAFIYQKEEAKMSWDNTIYTPRLLNIGCSFTNQAVKNVLDSLTFESPQFEKKDINLIWNKRWISETEELGYVLDTSKKDNNKRIINYFFENADILKIKYLMKFGEYSASSTINSIAQSNTCEESLLIFFENCDVEKYLTNEIKNTQKIIDSFNLNEFSNCFTLNESFNQYECVSTRLSNKDANIQALHAYINDNLSKINLLTNDINVIISKIGYPSKELEQQYQDNIHDIVAKANIELKIKNLFNLQKNDLKFENELLNNEINKIKIQPGISEKFSSFHIAFKKLLKIKSNIKLNLNSNEFSEFFYASSNINNLLKNINNMDIFQLYNELNIILDNTLRYKMFHLSMRLKEYYFLQLTNYLRNLPNNSYSEIYYKNGSKGFKNTKELYELHYLSIIFPLLVSTLHSLTNKTKLYNNLTEKSYSKPTQIDNIIVDEAGQISLEIGYIAAWNAKKLICVGDTDQIKPVFPVFKSLDFLISKDEKRAGGNLNDFNIYATEKDNFGSVNGCESSLMHIAQKLCFYHQYQHKNLSRGLYLVEHRRCPDEIIDYCNHIIYKGILIPKKGDFTTVKAKENSFFNNHIKTPWQFISVEGSVNKNKNENEAKEIFQYLEKFIQLSNQFDNPINWFNLGEHLAILTPYRNQADYILRYILDELENKGVILYKGKNRLKIEPNKDSSSDLIIGTVHALQGAEKKIILVSLVAQELSDQSMILRDKSILNVAISRSKLNIILFGNQKLLNNNSQEFRFIKNVINLW